MIKCEYTKLDKIFAIQNLRVIMEQFCLLDFNTLQSRTYLRRKIHTVPVRRLRRLLGIWLYFIINWESERYYMKYEYTNHSRHKDTPTSKSPKLCHGVHLDNYKNLAKTRENTGSYRNM